MYTRQIIKDIETYYSRYSESTSDQMLYYTTKHLIIFLYSFDIVNVILSNLKKEYSYEDSKIKEYEEMTGFEIIKHVAKDKKQYISYILHYLEYTFDSNQIVDFYNDASWICYNNSDYNIKERIMLFKTDVIKPLCDYVIDELRKHVSLLYVLNKFKNRTMRFETPYQVNIMSGIFKTNWRFTCLTMVMMFKGKMTYLMESLIFFSLMKRIIHTLLK